jgi:hypothetical protein
MKKNVAGSGTSSDPGIATKRRKVSEIWWISYEKGGKQIRESAHTANESEAWRLLKDRDGKITSNQPTGRVIERTTLDDLLKLIENNYAVKGRRSLRRVEYAERNLREYFDGGRRASNVASEDIAAYAAYQTEKGAAPASVNYDMAILRRGFWLGKKIVSALPDFKMMGLSNTRKGFLSPGLSRGP